jgi:hypothetical protein
MDRYKGAGVRVRAWVPTSDGCKDQSYTGTWVEMYEGGFAAEEHVRVCRSFTYSSVCM